MAEKTHQTEYLTWEAGNKSAQAIALAQASEGLRKVQPIVRAAGSDIFMNIAPGNVSVRDGYSQRDYNVFRRDEAVPEKPKDIIRSCMSAYYDIGIIRNTIDMMADFGCQGIGLVHPNERIEKFFQEWFRKVGGPERSERFLNVLYRCGNVVVKRQTAKLTAKNEEEFRRAKAEPDTEIDEPVKLAKREVPWRYTFFNPLTLELLAEELAPFVGSEAYLFGVKIPANVAKRVKNPKGMDKLIVNKLPPDIVEHIRSGKNVLPLDPDKTLKFYYKKDDWLPWAMPMVHSILPDIQTLRKHKLADLSALDGAISCIRVWKLGNLEARVMPSEGLILRLAEMLNNNVGGGVMDLVWGPDIELLETKTDVHQFLGNTKYEPTLTAIYAGLGIPPTMTGAATSGGYTNNFISLKTLTERLEYGRSILRAFWEHEIRMVQRAMGFRFPAVLVFDRMVLTDEQAEKQLLLNMWDRGLVSEETLQERFGEIPDIELVRIRREERWREQGYLPPKAGPFFDAQQDFSLKKIYAQSGLLAPSELGVELKEKKAGEKTPMEHKMDTTPKPAPGGGPKGQPGQGRPSGKKDSQKRKKKTVKPRTSAAFVETLGWAEDAQTRLSKIVIGPYLKSLGKKTLRELTDEESNNFEAFKFNLLCQFNIGDTIDQVAIGKAVAEPLLVPDNVRQLLRAAIAKYVENNGKEPPFEVLRRFQASVYALYKGEYEEESV